MVLVYLDANVLVPSYTRTLLVMAAPLSEFTVVWSLHAEAEAERHQEPGAAAVCPSAVFVASRAVNS